MGKFNSNWIERNFYYREKAGATGDCPHFVQCERPVIVCLCGSTRFWREFQNASLRETLAGRIVLSIGAARCADDDDKSFGGYVPEVEFDKVKDQLDDLHCRKIDLADEVLVLNCPQMWCLNHQRWTERSGPDMEYCCANVEPRGYIGDSTRREVRHAIKGRKTLRWLEPDKIPAEFDGSVKQTA